MKYIYASINNADSISINIGKNTGGYPNIWIVEVAQWHQNVCYGGIGLVKYTGYDIEKATCVLVNKDSIITNHTISSDGKLTVTFIQNLSYVKITVLNI